MLKMTHSRLAGIESTSSRQFGLANRRVLLTRLLFPFPASTRFLVYARLRSTKA